jgi:LuxR family maltose regulon positive regulatory protein
MPKPSGRRRNPEPPRDPAVRTTKLLRPRLPADAVDRPRLREALDRGRACPLVLLSGPAGFGKTTLLSQWLAAPPAPCPAAWVTVDDRDDVPGFVGHVLAALRARAPGTGRTTLGLLRLPGAVDPVDLGAALADELAVLPGEVVLVLDDLQEAADLGVYAFLDALLHPPPPPLRLVVATRLDPPLSLARLRARGQLLELRAAELRFTGPEAARFLARALPVAPTAEMVARLTDGTEGWGAGLRLAAVAAAGLPRQGQPEAVAAAFAGCRQAAVRDYLLEEVLDRQPPAVQDFLLRTAVPERVCAPLADALLAAAGGPPPAAAPPGPGPGSGAAFLAAVSRANLFLTALGEVPRGAGAEPAGAGAAGAAWYRYHPLFRDLLLRQLRERRGRAAPAALHAAAGAWFAAAGMVEEGLHHHLAAGAHDAAAALVEAHAHPALESGRWPALERWLDLLPPAAQRRPGLAVARAWVATRRGRHDALPALLPAARALLDVAPAVSPAERTTLEGQLAGLAVAGRFLAGDLAGTLATAEEALARLPAGLPYARGWVAGYAIIAALAVEGGDAARRWLDAAGGGPPGYRDDRAVAWALQGLSSGLIWSGRYPEAADVGQVMVQQGAALGIAHCRFWGHAALGAVHYEWDRPDEAARHFAAVLAEPDAAPLLALRGATYGLALVRQAQGRPGEADAAVDRLAGALLATGNTRQLAQVAAFRARLALLRDDLVAVRAWLGDVEGRDLTWRGNLLDAPPLTRVWARLRLAAGAPAAAAAHALGAAAAELDAFLEEAERWRAGKRQAEALALRALVLDAAGDEPAALAALGRAVDVGAPGRLRRTFLDLGPPLLRLLARLPAGRRPAGPGGARPAAGRASPAALPEPLTARELEVLAGLAQRWSNKEIAAALHVTPDTVKTHAARVYAKLGAPGRREAVRRAADLGLLPPG